MKNGINPALNIAIIGGGINGLCSAWVLAQQGHAVQLFERDALMQATSRSSSKLLHGGLRYLENYEFRLVREALRERDAWLQRAPQLAQPLRLVLPIYQNCRRSRALVALGLWLYDHIAGRSILPPAQWLSRAELLQRDPQLQDDGLLGGYAYSDGHMDDQALGLWVAQQARAAGVQIHEHSPVQCIKPTGELTLADGQQLNFDRIANIAGPWALQLLAQSGLQAEHRLDLVRGSHLVLDTPCPQAYLLEAPGERRIFFVLPWQGKTLLGTTEVRQGLDEAMACSAAEEAYLLAAYQHYRDQSAPMPAVVSRFAGVRPLIYSAADPNRATREYALEKQGRILSVIGGKWTTSMALAGKVADKVTA